MKLKMNARTAREKRRLSGHAMNFIKQLSQIWNDISTDARGRPIHLSEAMALGVELIQRSCETGHKLMFIGNGGSAAIASHQALDYWQAGGLEAIAFNDASQLTCMANDRGFENVFAVPIRRFARLGDVLVAISSSGRSPNILRGVEEARKKGCSVITLSGFDLSNPLRISGDINFYVPLHSYGIVEISHLALLGAMLEEIVKSGKPPFPLQTSSTRRG